MGAVAVHANYNDAADLDPTRDQTLADRIRRSHKRHFYGQVACTVLFLVLFVVFVILLGFFPSVALLILCLIWLAFCLISSVYISRDVRQRWGPRRNRRQQGEHAGGGGSSSEVEVDGFLYNQEDGTFVPILAIPDPSSSHQAQDSHQPADPTNTLAGMPILQAPSRPAAQGSPAGRSDGDKVYGTASYYHATGPSGSATAETVNKRLVVDENGEERRGRRTDGAREGASHSSDASPFPSPSVASAGYSPRQQEAKAVSEASGFADVEAKAAIGKPGRRNRTEEEKKKDELTFSSNSSSRKDNGVDKDGDGGDGSLCHPTSTPPPAPDVGRPVVAATVTARSTSVAQLPQPQQSRPAGVPTAADMDDLDLLLGSGPGTEKE